MGGETSEVQDPAAALEELTGLLARPLHTGADAAPNEQPARGEAGPALAVALPGDLEEVRAVLGWARRHRVQVLPQGAVTGLVGASTPPPNGPAPLVLSTDALIGRLEIDPISATAVVSAGVRLSMLNEAAAVHGLELPVDLAADPAVGAMVATNTGGSRVLRHGDMSAWVLGAQAATADEQLSVIGDARPLHKDNTGPRIDRLLIGSAGAFGVVVEVALALAPRPAARATALIGPLPDTAAVALLGALRRTLRGALSAYEVMCPGALRAALDHVAEPLPLDPGSDPAVTVLVEASWDHLAGDDTAETALAEAVLEAGTMLGEELSEFVRGAASVPPRRAWGLRHAVTDGLRARGTVLGFDLATRPADLPALRAAVRELVAELDPGWQVADFGHWGDGGVHCNVVVPRPGSADPAAAAELRHRVHALVIDRFGGSFSAEHGIGPLNSDTWLQRTPATTRALLATVKASVDPLGILGHPGLPLQPGAGSGPPPASR